MRRKTRNTSKKRKEVEENIERRKGEEDIQEWKEK